MTTRRLLLILWIIFVVKGAFYSILLPLWEGYDEYAHFAFVQYLALHHELPPPDARVSREVQESLQLVPLPWMLRSWQPPYLTHDAYWQLDAAQRAARELRLRNLPEELSQQTGTDYLYEGKQAPLYYWCLSWLLGFLAHQSIVATVFSLRIVSILIASSIIPITFVTARHLFGRDSLALQVAALVAAFPELYIDVARVGNESLAIPVFSLFVYACLRTAGSAGYLIWAAIFLGLGLVTKAYFAPLSLAFAILVLWLYLKQPGKQSLQLILISGAIVCGIGGWWYYRNIVTPKAGLWVDAAPAQSHSIVQIAAQVVHVDWRTALQSLFRSYLWFGSWSFLQVRTWMYQVFEVIVSAGILGLARFGKANSKHKFGAALNPSHVAILAGIYACFILGIAYVILVNFLNSGLSASAGWYLYAAILPEVLLITVGLLSLMPVAGGRLILPFSTACLALLELYTVHFQLLPYYTGLIAHGPTGAVQSFHLDQLRNGGLFVILTRLGTNRPEYLHTWAIVGVWSLFITATLGSVALSWWLAVSRVSIPQDITGLSAGSSGSIIGL